MTMKAWVSLSILCNAVLMIISANLLWGKDDRAHTGPTSTVDRQGKDSRGFDEELERYSSRVPKSGSAEDAEEPRLFDALMDAGWTEEDAKTFIAGSTLQNQILLALTNDGADLGNSKPMNGSYAEREAQEGKLAAVFEEYLDLALVEQLNVSTYPMDADKARKAARVTHDYEAERRRIRAEAGGMYLPEDMTAMRSLAEEYRREMQGVLSPEELYEFSMRQSGLAHLFRSKLRRVEPTEEEFREVYRLQYDLDRLTGSTDPEVQQQRDEAREQFDARVAEILGEERQRRFEREGKHFYTQTVAIAERLSLPIENANQAYELREEAQRLYDEILKSGKPLSERREMEKELREMTSEELSDLLGEQGFELFQQHGGLHWLDNP